MIDDSLELDTYLDDFGESALIGSAEIKVIFDNDYSAAFGDFAEARTITATGKTTDLGKLKHFDSIAIAGKTYSIVGVHPAQDGKLTELVLQE